MTSVSEVVESRAVQRGLLDKSVPVASRHRGNVAARYVLGVAFAVASSATLAPESGEELRLLTG